MAHPSRGGEANRRWFNADARICTFYEERIENRRATSHVADYCLHLQANPHD
jgi:hypothetical protein